MPQIGQVAEEILTSEKIKEENDKKMKDARDENEKLKTKVQDLERLQVAYEEKLKLEEENLENAKFSGEVKLKRVEG